MDSGFLAFLFLNGGNEILAAAHVAVERVQILAVAGLYHAALSHGKRRLVNNRMLHKLADVAQRVDRGINVPQLARLHCAQKLPHRRKRFGGIGKGAYLTGIRRAVRYAGHKAFYVAYSPQRLNYIVPENRIPAKLVHGVLTRLNGNGIHKRTLDDIADHALAHRRLCPVKNPQQRAFFFLGAHCLGEFQIPARGSVDIHKDIANIIIYAVEAFYFYRPAVIFLRRFACHTGGINVVDERAECHNRWRIIEYSRTLRFLWVELCAYCRQRVLIIEFLIVEQLDGGFQTAFDEFIKSSYTQRRRIDEYFVRVELTKLPAKLLKR